MILPPGQSCLSQHWPQDWSVVNDICSAKNFNRDQDSVSFLMVELVTAKCRYQWRLLFRVRERRLGGEKEEEEEGDGERSREREGRKREEGGGGGEEEEGEGSGRMRGDVWGKKRRRKRKEKSRYS